MVLQSFLADTRRCFDIHRKYGQSSELFRSIVFFLRCLRSLFTFHTIVIFTDDYFFLLLHFLSLGLVPRFSYYRFFSWNFFLSFRFPTAKYQYYLKRRKNKEKLGCEQVFIAISSFFFLLFSFFSSKWWSDVSLRSTLALTHNEEQRTFIFAISKTEIVNVFSPFVDALFSLSHSRLDSIPFNVCRS